MTDLHELFDDLVTEVPPYVVPDARRAWATGARRRVTRRIGVGVAVVALVALAAGLVGVLPRSSDLPPADGERGGVEGYPARIDKPWFVRDLPDRPGPLAALLESGFQWYAVAPGGQAWRVPQDDPIDSFPPALSEDGTMLGYLTGTTSYVLRDLTTGEETTFPQLTDNAMDRSREGAWSVAPQSPGFWSPDRTRLLLRAAAWGDDRPFDYAAVLGVDGSVTDVREWGFPLGWLDDETLAWLATTDDATELVVTDVAGTVQRRSPVAVAGSRISQWSGTLSPDRSLLVMSLGGDTGTLVTVSTTSGRVVKRENVGSPDTCAPAWAGDDPAFFQAADEASLMTAPGRRLIITDPGLRATCLLVAADALAGERHEGFGARRFGYGNGWLSWHWQEVVTGTAGGVLVVVAAGVVLFRRRRGTARA